MLKLWLDLGVDSFRYDAARNDYDANEDGRDVPTLRKNSQF